MIYSSANQRAQDIEKLSNKQPVYKLAEVTSVSGGEAVIRFRGETSPSSKRYKRLSSYTPAVNDTVLLLKTGVTYVILGKVV